MSKETFQKIKLLKIWEMLCKDSDENHPLDTITIIDKLSRSGISCERRTLYKDIEALNEYGYKVHQRRSKRNEYYTDVSEFSVPELRILIDAVESVNFITEAKTEDLVNKIAHLGGSYQADTLKNGVYFDTQKYKNEDIYNNVLMLDEAILANRKVSFRYFDYDECGSRVYRKGGKRYCVNPLALVFNSDCYYLVCYSDKYKNLSNYRIDRMDNVLIDKDKIEIADCAKCFDIAEYRRKTFSMFTGEEARVEIEFDKSLIDVMMDKYGSRVKIKKVDDKSCRLIAKVQISPVFFGWCATLGDKLRIVSPYKVTKQYLAYIKKIISHYDKHILHKKQ